VRSIARPLLRYSFASVLALMLTASGCRPEAGTVEPEGRAGAVQDPAEPGAGGAGEAGVLEHELRIFDAKGRERSLGSLLDELAKRDVVLLGETHLDDVTHRFELAVLEGLAKRREGKVVLSMEMFERDVQGVLDRYLAGEIDEAAFLAESRPWGNYRPDYRPLVETARARKLPVVAANAPRPVMRTAMQGAQKYAEARKEHPEWLPAEVYPASDAYWARVDRAIRGHGPGGGGDARTRCRTSGTTRWRTRSCRRRRLGRSSECCTSRGRSMWSATTAPWRR
jgi:hypothetical protein